MSHGDAPRHLLVAVPRPRDASPQAMYEWAKQFSTWMEQRLWLIDQQNDLSFQGTGSPENVVTAHIGSVYLRTDGGASTTLYIKESGNLLSTGWVAK